MTLWATDRSYDNKNAKGPIDSTINLNVLGADAALLASAQWIYITTNNVNEKLWSAAVLVYFGSASIVKTSLYIHLNAIRITIL